MAFVSSNGPVTTPFRGLQRTACCSRVRASATVMLAAKRAGRGNGNKHTARSKGASSEDSSKSQASGPSRPAVPQETTTPAGDGYMGPLAPPPEVENEVAENAPLYMEEDELPVANEARIRLPDVPAAAVAGAMRRRRKRRAVDVDTDDADFSDGMDDTDGPVTGTSAVDGIRKLGDISEQDQTQSAVDAVRKLTDEYRKGSAEASEKLMREIQMDPDFMFQTGNATGEYDLAAALIGTGSPNKQGIYVLPYLQSGHVLLLLVLLLCAFVYNPGFPLTELDDEIRDWLKIGLALTYASNAVLAWLAYRAAKLRSQPPAFWVAKTLLLGGLAFQELRSNVPLNSDREALADRRKMRKGNRKNRTTK